MTTHRNDPASHVAMIYRLQHAEFGDRSRRPEYRSCLEPVALRTPEHGELLPQMLKKLPDAERCYRG